MPEIRIGCSGWTYPPWRGNFYPKGLVQKRELEHASRQLNAIEVNGTFYSLQRPSSFQTWYEQTPKDFKFAIKGGQYITHIRRLKEIDNGLANFFASGILILKEKLGPILWQLPPNLTFKDDRFEKFMKKLPRDSKAAARLAKKHTEKIKGREWTKPGGDYPIRHAFEVRHKSFFNEKWIKLLRKYKMGLVFAHAGKEGSPYMEDLTSDFVYMRLHGEGSSFSKGYSSKDLSTFAQKARAWTSAKDPKSKDLVLKAVGKKKRDVFIFFDNANKKSAPKNAVELLKKLKIKVSQK